MGIAALALTLAFANLAFARPAFGAEIPAELKDVGITEKLGQTVSLSGLSFTDEFGKTVQLSDYSSTGRPILLNIGYYGCPTLCSFVLDGLVRSLKGIEWIPGGQFELVSVSIDPTEDASLASKKKANYLELYGKPAAAEGWHFLTGKEEAIRKLTSAVGFGYKYNEEDKQYAHGAALIVLTPEGKISRYLYGIEYKPQDIKLALVEASDGKVGSVIDRILLFCYRYDAKQKKYSLVISKVMQAGGAGTLLIFGGYLAIFWRRERRESEPHV